MREKLYTRQGSRFVPVHECRYLDALPKGAWLIIVGPGNWRGVCRFDEITKGG